MASPRPIRFWLAVALAFLLGALGHWGLQRLLAPANPMSTDAGWQVSVCKPPFCDSDSDQRSVAAESPDAALAPAVQAVPPSGTPAQPANASAEGRLFMEIEPTSAPALLHNASHSVCVLDPEGDGGLQWRIMFVWQQAALAASVMRPSLALFRDEADVMAAFEDGACNAVWLPDRLADDTWPLAVQVSAPGAVPTAAHELVVAEVLTSPQVAGRYGINEVYHLAGQLFTDQLLLFVRHRPADHSLLGLAGAVVGVTTAGQQQLVERLGGTPRLGTLQALVKEFNTGSLQALLAPGAAAHLLAPALSGEPQLVAIDWRFAGMTHQLLARPDAFNEVQIAWSRTHLASLQSVVQEHRDKWRNALEPGQVWPLDDNSRLALDALMAEFRRSARDAGRYDAGLMALLRKVRCKLDVSRAECVQPLE